MNSFTGMGRISSDIKSYIGGENMKGMVVFNIAISNRARRDSAGNVMADFLPCVAYGNIAQTINTYLTKGDQICIRGRLQTSSYEDKNGIQRRSTEIVVEEMDFCGSKRTTTTESDKAEKAAKGSKKAV